MNIYRIIECKNSILTEIAFCKDKKTAKAYLHSCYKHNHSNDLFYFAELINV